MTPDCERADELAVWRRRVHVGVALVSGSFARSEIKPDATGRPARRRKRACTAAFTTSSGCLRAPYVLALELGLRACWGI